MAVVLVGGRGGCSAGPGAGPRARPRLEPPLRPLPRAGAAPASPRSSRSLLVPLAGRRLRARPADRHPHRRALRGQPALPDGPGGHALVRPRRLFRPRRLWRGALRQGAGGCRWSSRCSLAPLLAALGALVFGWFCVRLSGVYLAMLTLAFAQIVWSVVFQWDARHRRQQRPGRHLALGLAAPKPAYYLLVARLARVAGCGLLCACCIRAVRPGAARQPRLAAARRRDRHRRAAPAVDRLRRRRHCRRPGRRAVRLRQGNDLARDARRRQVGRRPGDGAARRRPGALGPVAGAALFTWLQDTVARQTDYWRACSASSCSR